MAKPKRKIRAKAWILWLAAAGVLLSVGWVAVRHQHRREVAARAVELAQEVHQRRHAVGDCAGYCFEGVIDAIDADASVLHVVVTDHEGREQRAVVKRDGGPGRPRVGLASRFTCDEWVEDARGALRFSGCRTGPVGKRLAQDERRSPRVRKGPQALEGI